MYGLLINYHLRWYNTSLKFNQINKVTLLFLLKTEGELKKSAPGSVRFIIFNVFF
jgi:hypothetical protein